MSRYRRTRDGNEAAIVDALRAMGCSVARLDGRDGIPDLLVGYTCPHGWRANVLLEVKNPANKRRAGNHNQYVPIHEFRAGGRFEGMSERLDRRQAEWHKNWRGMLVKVATTTEEACTAVHDTTTAQCHRCSSHGTHPADAWSIYRRHD